MQRLKRLCLLCALGVLSAVYVALAQPAPTQVPEGLIPVDASRLHWSAAGAYYHTGNKQVDGEIDQALKSAILSLYAELNNPATRITVSTDAYRARGVDSFLFHISGMYPQLAHPYDTITSVRFLMPQGKRIDFEQAFAPKEAALEALSAYTLSALLRNGALGEDPLYMDALEGTAPEEANFQNFAFTPEGVLVQFDTYQVGPRPVGQPTAIVPYGWLEEGITILPEDSD